MLEDFDSQFEQAAQLDPSAAKVAMLHRAIAFADERNQSKNSVRGRLALVTAAVFCGRPDDALVAFSWLLGKLDAEPETVPLHRVLWMYKWIIGRLDGFPTVSLETIWEMEDDMERRFAEAGYSLRPVLQSRASNAISTGHRDRARQYLAEWQLLPRDSLADCAACERQFATRIMLYQGKREQAIEGVERIIAENLRCNSVPLASYARILRPLVESGRADQADEYHRVGLRMARRKAGQLWSKTRHVAYMIRQGWLSAALRRCRQDADVAAQAGPGGRCHFLAVHSLLFERLAEQQTEVTFRLPRELINAGANETVPAVIAQHMADEHQNLVNAFNQRNGNDRCSVTYRNLQAFANAEA